jgi:hypothetical protein
MILLAEAQHILPKDIDGIIDDNFANVTRLSNKSFTLIESKNNLLENFTKFNRIIDECRIYLYNDKTDPNFSITNHIDFFNKVKHQIHCYLDQNLPIPKDELLILQNYNFLNRSLSNLNLTPSSGFQYDIRIDEVASRIRSLTVKNTSESINQQESNQSLSHNNLTSTLLPIIVDPDQSSSQKVEVTQVQQISTNRVREMAKAYDQAHTNKIYDPRLQRMSSLAFDKNPSQSSSSSTIGLGRVFSK